MATEFTISAGPVMLGAFVLATFVGLQAARRGARRSRIALEMTAIIYSAIVLVLTVFPLRFGTLAFNMSADPHWRNSVNLVPLRTIELYLTTSAVGAGIRGANLLGNLLLLTPMGFTAPALSRRLDGWWRIAALGLMSAGAIELMQFARKYVLGMTGRSVDIDDVILNAAGALIGYGMLTLVRPAWRRWRGRSAEAV